jgi:hypothetical protein
VIQKLRIPPTYNGKDNIIWTFDGSGFAMRELPAPPIAFIDAMSSLVGPLRPISKIWGHAGVGSTAFNGLSRTRGGLLQKRRLSAVSKRWNPLVHFLFAPTARLLPAPGETDPATRRQSDCESHPTCLVSEASVQIVVKKIPHPEALDEVL